MNLGIPFHRGPGELIGHRRGDWRSETCGKTRGGVVSIKFDAGSQVACCGLALQCRDNPSCPSILCVMVGDSWDAVSWREVSRFNVRRTNRRQVWEDSFFQVSRFWRLDCMANHGEEREKSPRYVIQAVNFLQPNDAEMLCVE